MHGRAFMAASACNELQALCRRVSRPLANILEIILELYLIEALLNRLGDFLRVTNICKIDLIPDKFDNIVIFYICSLYL